MEARIWILFDKTINILNKIESIMSLILMITFGCGKIFNSIDLINLSIILIFILGITAVLLLIAIFIRRIRDESFVRSFYLSQRGIDIKRNFNKEYRIRFINSRKPESVYIELEKDEYIFSILKIRKWYSYEYVKKLIDIIYNEFDRD